ncbi:MAG: hypothetical protein CMM52_04615 [Rhodospirillaceae bacterium]|nr:hypothetical protein [Rhodospirillaceae bacterium]
MRIARRNTTVGCTPYEGVTFAFFDPQTESQYSSKAESDKFLVEVPSEWSTEACAFFCQNCLITEVSPRHLEYVREESVPRWLWRRSGDKSTPLSDTNGIEFSGEISVRAAIDRISGGWTYLGWKAGYFDSEEDASAFYDEIRWLLCHRKFTPELAQWQKNGAFWAYGITTAPVDSFVTDYRTGLVRRSETHDVAPSGAQIVSPENTAEVQETLAKLGCAIGTYPKQNGEHTSAFKDARAGIRVTLDGTHPETLNDLWKDGTSDARDALESMGYEIATRHLQSIIDSYSKEKNFAKQDGSNSAALTLAIKSAKGAGIPENIIERTLQLIAQISELRAADILGPTPDSHADVSPLSNKSLMVRLEDGPIDSAIEGDDANYQIFDSIAYGAWTGRKTGIQYSTTIEGWHTCPADGDINATAGGGDFVFLDDTACHRSAIDCAKFRGTEFEFDVEGLSHAVTLISTAMDISLICNTQNTTRTAKRVWNYRPLGLSITGIAEIIMSYGLPYDSDDARAVAAAICSFVTATAYANSAAMASELGTFPSFTENRESMMRVIRNHRRANDGDYGGYEFLGWNPRSIDPRRGLPNLHEMTVDAWKRAESLGMDAGFRNAQVTLVTAEINTSTILANNAHGLLPIPSLCRHDLDASGKYRNSLAPCVWQGLKALGYSQVQTEAFANSVLGHRTLKNAPSINHETLKHRGFTDDLIDKVEDALIDAIDLSQVFNPWILGVDQCIELLGVGANELENPAFDLLASMGFSDSAIRNANSHCFGDVMEAKLPYRHNAHAVVFVTGSTPAPEFDRVDSVIRMMAAVQPMISGGIGHSIALPRDTSVADCHVIFMTGWRMGLKSLCLYRDEYDHSSSLNSTFSKEPADREADELSNSAHSPPTLMVIQGGKSSATTGAMRKMKARTQVPEFFNGTSPAAMSQALAIAHATRGFSGDRTLVKEAPGKNRTVITHTEENKTGGAETSRRPASDTARSTASDSSSSDAVVEQRHI